MKVKTENEKLIHNIIGYSWWGCGYVCIMVAYFKDEGVRALIKNIHGLNEDQDLLDTYLFGSSFPLEAAKQCINLGGAWLKDEHENWTPEKDIYTPLKFTFKPKK